ncbi:M14 family zinc carboxypeptidase [Bacillus sp. 31A1R]|uniref:M14 family zinc carboxypeptidase n=1 Tax=Robertmurraya mangrovi TaxID=3098077 RepID=A0ABU5IXM3_9BACI|nr:M14 family zinc carboxypeptidase [Bacillus sp. 31A1R]MDZ5471918.1 M14 family zinc carboxypeptidase [Bacillus sp. 31A1R]
MRKNRFTLLFVIFTVFILILPFTTQAKSNIVNPNEVYSYSKMIENIKKLERAYPDLIKSKVIGKSEYGRNIYAFSLGKGKATVFINGSHHAREWLTTSLNMYMAENYAIAYKKNQKINGYDARKILDSTTIWFVPMVNPDGVTLQQKGLSAFPKHLHTSLIKMNEGSKNFKRWKANGKGVDLNRQYDAGWKSIIGPSTPRYKNYKGKAPHTASEVKAVLKLVEEINPEMTVAYHSTGKILYWNYKQNSKDYKRDHVYAKQIGRMTGYRLVYPGKNPSGGGFTDWFIQQKKKPGFTPEISRYYTETSPPLSEFKGAWSENKAVGLYVAKEGAKLYETRLTKKANELKNKLASLNSSSRKLKDYYYTNIQSANDHKINTKFVTLYNSTEKQLKELEKLSNKYPTKFQEQHDVYISYIKTRLSYSKAYMDGVKLGEKTEQNHLTLISVLEKGILDEATINRINSMEKTIPSLEAKMDKMYGKLVRKLAKDKYITPGKKTIESIKYDIERYNTIIQMEKDLNEGNLELVSKNLDLLTTLEQKSNKVYPLIEQYLNEKKQWIVDELNKRTPTEEDIEVKSQENSLEDSQESINKN